MVARGASAAGPVLLACRQWDPLGLARRLPSLEVGAWRSAQLLPWRVSAPSVCARCSWPVRGARAGTWCCVSPASPFPPRVSRAACGGPSRPGVPYPRSLPFHAVCAFRELGPVALLVVPACSLRVCALALPRRPIPPPLGGVACAPRAVPALGAGRAVRRGPCPSACPAPVPSSVWCAWAGRYGPGSPLPGLGLSAPLWGGSVAYALWGLRAAGVAGGRPRGGWPATVVRGVWCQVVSYPRPPVLWSGQPGFRDPCVPGAVDAGVGIQHRPHSVRPCGLALLAVGVAEGRPRGRCLPPL